MQKRMAFHGLAFPNIVRSVQDVGNICHVKSYASIWMKLFIHSQISTVEPLKIGNGWIISTHTLQDIWILIHAGIKVNHYK